MKPKTIFLLCLVLLSMGCAAINPAHRDNDYWNTYRRWEQTTLYWYPGSTGI